MVSWMIPATTESLPSERWDAGMDARRPQDMATSAQPTRFRDDSAESLGARVFSCDFQVHAPPDWRGEIGEKSTEDYIANDYLPQVFASGRQVIGVPQHDAISNQGEAKTIRDIARRLRSEDNHG